MANHFQIPQGDVFIPGYYYSNVELTISNLSSRGAYIGTIKGNSKTSFDHRYIYYISSTSEKPTKIEEFLIPVRGNVYLISTERSQLGDYPKNNNNTSDRAKFWVPTGRIGIFYYNNGVQLYDFQGSFCPTFSNVGPSWPNNTYVDIRAHVESDKGPDSDANRRFRELLTNISQSSSNLNGKIIGANNATHDWPEWQEGTQLSASDRAMIETFNELSRGYVWVWRIDDWQSGFVPGSSIPAPVYSNGSWSNVATSSIGDMHQFGLAINGGSVRNWIVSTLGEARAVFQQTANSLKTHVQADYYYHLKNGQDIASGSFEPANKVTGASPVVFNSTVLNKLKSLCANGILSCGKDEEAQGSSNYDIYITNYSNSFVSGDPSTINSGWDSDTTVYKQFFNICRPSTWQCLDLVTYWWRYALGVYINADSNGDAPVRRYSDTLGWATSWADGYFRQEGSSIVEFSFNSGTTKTESGTSLAYWPIENLQFHIQGYGAPIGTNGKIVGHYSIRGRMKLDVKKIPDSVEENGYWNFTGYQYGASESQTIDCKYFLPNISILNIDATVMELGTGNLYRIYYKKGSMSDGDNPVVEYLGSTTVSQSIHGNGNIPLPPGSEVLSDTYEP